MIRRLFLLSNFVSLHDMKPKIAIVNGNALMNIGLKAILERIIPMAEVCVFGDFDKLPEEHEFFHFFVSSQIFAEHNRFFAERIHKIIVLVASEQNRLPAGVHTLNVSHDEESIVRDILRLHQSAHRDGHNMPHTSPAENSMPLSQRECDVLRLLVRGMLNKEIADALEISINTVITHRRNITEKLGTRSVSALTIYAVTHGIADIESI